MAKKRGKRTQKKKQKGWFVPKKQINNWLNQAVNQIMQQDYPGAVQTCRRILRYAPSKSEEWAEAMEHLATAYTMLKQFEEAYQTLSQVLEINPRFAHMWYNRGLTGRYTMRLVQAVYDFEKAVELETDPQQRKNYIEILTETRQMAEEERALRGPDFSLEQLREQQNLFSHGLQLLNREKWAEAEQVLRRVTEMADCLPQPQGNLGLALLMQKKYDEAEIAFKRALEIQPDYDLAQRNLAMLPLVRQSGETPDFALREAFAEANVNLTVKLVDDD